jgi:hypothetical protein
MAMRTKRECAVARELRSLLGAMSDEELLMPFRQYPPDSPQRDPAIGRGLAAP